MVQSREDGVSSKLQRRLDTPISETGSSESTPDISSNIIEVASDGDIVLQIEHEAQSPRSIISFRVNSQILRTTSKYFQGLLQPGRFGEAAEIEAKRKLLREQYENIADVPAVELPAVQIKDLGRISAVKAVDYLIKDFLFILHDKDIQASPPIANLANIAIVADRFDSLEKVKEYVQRKKMVRAIDGKTTPKLDTSLSEEKVRQRLLVAILLDYHPWIEKYTTRLIIKGWIQRESDVTAALWWDLPSRFEDELACRRDCILETIQSLLSHFLRLYTSRERQCKLGYDSSPQCDSFQLGEMVRFFSRIDVLRLQGTITDLSEAPSPHEGDLYNLLDTFRQVPEYQIDKFHTHCGIRTRLLPLLDLVQECLQSVGICPECWSDERPQYAWVDVKRPWLWKRQAFRPRTHGHGSRHTDIRALFTATERDWTA